MIKCLQWNVLDVLPKNAMSSHPDPVILYYLNQFIIQYLSNNRNLFLAKDQYCSDMNFYIIICEMKNDNSSNTWPYMQFIIHNWNYFLNINVKEITDSKWYLTCFVLTMKVLALLHDINKWNLMLIA